MREPFAKLCGNFIENRDRIRSAFAWETAEIYPVCAGIFAEKGRMADPQRMKTCRDIIKKKTGLFSNFGGTIRLPMISILSLSEYPEEKMDKALRLYGCLKEYFFSSEYLPVAAMMLTDLIEESGYEAIARRTKRIYDLMKQEHPFLTSKEDSVFAALLALSERTDEEVTEETEKCYEILKPLFFSGNAVQSLSHVLALGEGSADEKCRRTMALYDGLREKGCRYGTDYELATLGALALHPVELESLIQDMVEVDAFLSGQKGYGLFGVSRKQRLMHAAMLVSCAVQSGQTAMSSAALSGTISLIAAQEAAMCAAIAASAAAASSNNTAS
ncbi:MAG: DUF4003 family protein [Eubacteriales bacterium]|nr:DUF4003 family protein [Eubacteriales bacterium]